MSRQKSRFEISDYIGKKLGVSTVIGIDNSELNKTKWIMRCNCGNIFSEMPCRIMNGHKQSCGCYRYTNRIKHNSSYNQFYKTWVNIIARCYNKEHPAYNDYGARGIFVCDEWKDVKNFIKWAMETHPNNNNIYSIDRINNDGPYSPNNCKWSTWREQQRNKRNTIFYCIDGVRKSLIEWCEIYNISYCLAYSRLKRGWPIEKALTIPVKHTKGAQ